MKYPNTISRNIYLAYIHKESAKENVTKSRRNDIQLQHQNHQQTLDAINLNWDLNYPESLVELCIKTIAENWNSERVVVYFKSFSDFYFIVIFSSSTISWYHRSRESFTAC